MPGHGQAKFWPVPNFHFQKKIYILILASVDTDSTLEMSCKLFDISLETLRRCSSTKVKICNTNFRHFGSLRTVESSLELPWAKLRFLLETNLTNGLYRSKISMINVRQFCKLLQIFSNITQKISKR